MKDLLDNSRKEIEKIVFEKEDLNELVENEHKKEKKETIKILFISSFIFLLSTIGMREIMATVISHDNMIIKFVLSTVVLVSILISCVFFLLSFVNVIYYLFTKEESDKLERQIAVSEIKIEKLMKKNLNLEELSKLNPLLMKMKESLSEKELFDLMRTVEIRTNKQLGNAYYFFYLIKNYDDLVSEIKKQQKYDEDFQKQISCFFNIKKEY